MSPSSRFTRIWVMAAVCVLAWSPALLRASPPAPAYVIYGTLRDDHGRAIDSSQATVILTGPGGEAVRGPSDVTISPGVNYSLSVPMDSALSAKPYKPTAMQAGQVFNVAVVYGGTTYTPIEMAGKTWTVGQPSGTLRLDLTLGYSTAKDGLPDAWKQDIINSDASGRLQTLADIRPGDDLDGDGMTNLQEFLAGTNPLDRSDALNLKILDLTNGVAHMRFDAVPGRTYHLTNSQDLKTWVVQPFASDAVSAASQTAGSTVQYMRSADQRTVEVYVSVGANPVGVFRLYVE